MQNNNKIVLLILDGWGHGTVPEVSAITQANTPFVDGLYEKYPNAELITHGEAVGLPKGQMGNSEVGHLNIGAGRVVYQALMRINKAAENGDLAANKTLVEVIKYAQTNNKAVHLLGLVSDGGVHSHINHLKALCSIFDENKLDKVFVHAFTDGRDTSPNGAKGYLADLQTFLNSTGSKAKIASVVGRYYAMDRDKRWERIKVAYDLMVNGKGEATANVLDAVKQAYNKGFTDEFMPPIVATNEHNQIMTTIKAGDVVLCFNFRTDRCRQITTVLSQNDMPSFDMKRLPNLYYVTMTSYDDSFEGVKVVFDKTNLNNTLGEVLAANGKQQIRMAETEKYPHVTFFFSGGREEPFELEKRFMVNSPKVATYDLQPEMSAQELTTAIVKFMQQDKPDFICLNFANADMVGHTGVFEAAVKAAETVDACTKTVVESALKNQYQVIVIADHGNADIMRKPNGEVHTAHTTNLVPIFLVSNRTKKYQLKNGKLADVAPTILALLGIEQPKEMDGNVLIVPTDN